MRQQNYQKEQSFAVEKLSQLGPYHLLPKRKINQLQNRITFFEGQVDPLYAQNMVLKEQLISMSRLVSVSASTLRSLLPTQGSPSKKLKLEMANLEQISQMIRIDWKMMQSSIADKSNRISILQAQKAYWIDKHNTSVENYDRKIKQILKDHEQIKLNLQKQIEALHLQIQNLKEAQEKQKQRMRNQFADKMSDYEKLTKEFNNYKRQVYAQNSDYEKKIERLRGEIEANLLDFEQNKKVIKSIYDKLMADKLQEQAETFQMMLRLKEEQKDRLVKQMLDKQEELNRQLAVKQSDILKLSEQSYNLRQQINGLNDENWKRQQKIEEYAKNIKELELQVNKLNHKAQLLQKQIQEQAQMIKIEQQSHQKSIKQFTNTIECLKNQSSQALKKAINEKQQAQKSLQQKEKKLRETLISLKKIDSQYAEKISKLQQQWNQKQQNLKKQIFRVEKKLEESELLIKKKQIQMADLCENHLSLIKNIEAKNKTQREKLIKNYEMKIREIVDHNQQELIQIKIDHGRQLAEVNIKANQEMRQMMQECNRKLIQFQNQITSKTQREIQIAKQEALKLKEKLSKAQKKLLLHDEQLQNLKLQNIKSLKRLEDQAELEKKKLNDEMMKQMMQFQREMQLKQAMIVSMKTQMENEIKMLKQSNAIQSIENRFHAEINKLKNQFSQKYHQMQEQTKKLQEEHKQQVQKIVESFNNKIIDINKNHDQDLHKISHKMQINSTTLNDRLLNGQNDMIEGLQTEKKKQYIFDQVKNLKHTVQQKDRKIIEMQIQLLNKKKEIDDFLKTIDERIKSKREQLERQKDIFMKQCKNKVENTINECTAKVKQSERQRIQHSQILYSEFATLRQKHEHDYNLLKKKYNQIEKLFEQRPSRAQDLSKIKQLINLQTKMDIQIQTYHKKMETANQIVKYLNLQLENYKDTYDMFGPNNEGLGIVGSGKKETKNNYNDSESSHQNFIDGLKSQHHQISIEQKSQNKKSQKDPKYFRKWSENEQISQLKVFPMFDKGESRLMNENDKSDTYSPMIKESKLAAIVQPQKRQRQKYKTQKSQKLDKSAEIVMNAQNFIKFINGSKPIQVIKEVEQEGYIRRKSYRKRTMNKRLPTIGTQHFN